MQELKESSHEKKTFFFCGTELSADTLRFFVEDICGLSAAFFGVCRAVLLDTLAFSLGTNGGSSQQTAVNKRLPVSSSTTNGLLSASLISSLTALIITTFC